MPAPAGGPSLATIEAAMLQRILRWLTIARLAVNFNGNDSSASPLESGLAVPAERDVCMKEFVTLRKEAEVSIP
jgi:hypothetical protein